MSNPNDQPDWDELPTRAMTPESDNGQEAGHQMPGQEGQQPHQAAGQHAAQSAQEHGSPQHGQPDPYGQQGGQHGWQAQGQGQQPYEQPTQQQYSAQPHGQLNAYGQQQGGQYGSQPQSDPAAQQVGHQSQPGQPGGAQSTQYGSQNQAGQGAPAYSQNQPGATQQFGQQYGHPTPATKVGTSGPKSFGAMASWAAVVLSALAILGTFGTWAHLKMSSSATPFPGFDISANGLGSTSGSDGTRGHGGYTVGWFILVVALIAIGVAVMRALGKLPKLAGWGTTAAGSVITIIAFLKWFQIRSDFHDAEAAVARNSTGLDFSGSTGWGIILCLVAGVLVIVAGALSALRD